MADAFMLASYYVSTSTGTVPGLNVPAGTTVPVAQINTLADILASCVDTAGGLWVTARRAGHCSPLRRQLAGLRQM
jgi:hypothetical protein